MITDGDAPRDLSRLVMPLGGSLEATGDLFEPYRLVDGDGVVLVPAAAYFRELAACGRPAATHRSYGMLCRYLIWGANGMNRTLPRSCRHGRVCDGKDNSGNDEGPSRHRLCGRLSALQTVPG
jgi:hypothetical protein